MTAADNSKVFVIGTRRSQLAVTQTRWIQAKLSEQFPDYEFKIETIITTGDRIVDVALNKIGEKSLFTKELELALEDGRVDFVVHCLKDLPTVLDPSMALGAIVERESPYDALVLAERTDKKYTLDTLPKGSVIGTGSLRRTAQIMHKRPDLVIKGVRGNIDTRISKLDDPENGIDALILACAGLKRLGWGSRISQFLDKEMLYAVSQGALGIECRANDTRVLNLLKPLDHAETRLLCMAERALMRKLEGGCSVPIGVSATLEGQTLTLDGLVASLDGQQVVQFKDQVTLEDSATSDNKEKAAEELGSSVAQKLLDSGAGVILKAITADDKH